MLDSFISEWTLCTAVTILSLSYDLFDKPRQSYPKYSAKSNHRFGIRGIAEGSRLSRGVSHYRESLHGIINTNTHLL